MPVARTLWPVAALEPAEPAMVDLEVRGEAFGLTIGDVFRSVGLVPGDALTAHAVNAANEHLKKLEAR